MPFDLQFQEEDGAPLAGPLPDIVAPPALPGTEQVIRLVNVGDAAARIQRGLVLAGREPGTSDPFERTGSPWLDRRMFEARVIEGVERAVAPSGYYRMGNGSFLPLPPVLEPGEGVVIGYRSRARGNVAAPQIEVEFQVVTETHEALTLGHSEISGDGIWIGYRDPNFSAVISLSVMPNPGGADDQVQIDAVWIYAGIPYAVSELVELDGEDGDGASLASGEEYLATLTVGAGLVTVSKSPKGTGLSPADQVPGPAGELLAAYVRRDFAGVVEADDIEAGAPDLFGVVSTSGRTLTLGAGPVALVHNSYAYAATFEAVTMPAGSVSIVARGLEGLEVYADGDPAADLTLALYRVTSDADSITLLEDLRHGIGYREAQVRFDWAGTLASGSTSYRYAHVPPGREVLLAPFAPVSVALGEQASGASSGESAFELEYWDGAAWASVLAEPVEISFDAEEPAATARPLRYILTGGTRLRARITAIPTGGTAPVGASLLMRIAL